jgi:hypothetical protein
VNEICCYRFSLSSFLWKKSAAIDFCFCPFCERNLLLYIFTFFLSVNEIRCYRFSLLSYLWKKSAAIDFHRPRVKHNLYHLLHHVKNP